LDRLQVEPPALLGRAHDFDLSDRAVRLDDHEEDDRPLQPGAPRQVGVVRQGARPGERRGGDGPLRPFVERTPGALRPRRPAAFAPAAAARGALEIVARSVRITWLLVAAGSSVDRPWRGQILRLDRWSERTGRPRDREGLSRTGVRHLRVLP